MGYQTIKNGIATMLLAKGFVESNEVFDFKAEGGHSVDKRFRITRDEFSMDGAGSEYIATLVRPAFLYRIALGFKMSPERALFDYDVAQNLLDTVIAYFNNPANYSGYAISMKTSKATVEMVQDHLEAVVQLDVLDDITLA